MGAAIVGMVYGGAEEEGSIKTNKALMHAAEELGRRLVEAA